MEKRLGKRIFAAPFIVVIVIGCIFCLVIAPIAKLDPRDLPFAIVSQDEGITTPAGTINIGEMMVEKITSDENDESSTITWTKLDADSNVEDVMKSGDYFAAIVIPKDFSQKMMAAHAGASSATSAVGAAIPSANSAATVMPDASALASGASGALSPDALLDATSASEADKPTIDVIVDNAKSPIIPMMVQTMTGTIADKVDASVETRDLYPVQNSDSGMSFVSVLSQQFLIMPTMLMCIISSILLYLGFRTNKSDFKGKNIVFMTVLALVVAAFVSLMIMALAGWVFSLDLDYGSLFIFEWLAAFFIILLFFGALTIHPALGVFVILAVFVGLLCGIVPQQLLPAFWADFFHPWEPVRFLGDGLRGIMIIGQGPWPNGAWELSIAGGVGFVLLIIGCLMPHKTKKSIA